MLKYSIKVEEPQFMRPTQTLPEHFTLAWSLDIRHDLRLNLLLQLVGLALMALSGWLLLIILGWLRPNVRLASPANPLSWLLILLGVMIAVIILHELVHGLFFWLFSRHLPQFGLGQGYAFAAMPDWYFPRVQYLIIGLSPLLVLTGLGLVLCLFLPAGWLLLLLAGMAINVGGASGDIYVCLLIARETPRVLIRDTGDGFQLYRPDA